MSGINNFEDFSDLKVMPEKEQSDPSVKMLEEVSSYYRNAQQSEVDRTAYASAKGDGAYDSAELPPPVPAPPPRPDYTPESSPSPRETVDPREKPMTRDDSGRRDPSKESADRTKSAGEKTEKVLPKFEIVDEKSAKPDDRAAKLKEMAKDLEEGKFSDEFKKLVLETLNRGGVKALQDLVRDLNRELANLRQEHIKDGTSRPGAPLMRVGLNIGRDGTLELNVGDRNRWTDSFKIRPVKPAPRK